ncbi:hypothetical protein FNT36_03115 [Hymenobacter setariae]|uniref:Uncharacterized protein n=1 Tax=Hymenobacter setariae TaxID=2594794 RepID=A0A558C2Z7_9BACT|nr:hypothetical protein [Hymenobacter setariae]TVT43096.1 hypothetical protein FNT36_03115 [Hymenobacter setariae]
MEAKEIKKLAKEHAKQQLGDEQFKSNKDAARAIAEDFEAGFTAAQSALGAAATPAPLADAELAELTRLMNRATQGRWCVAEKPQGYGDEYISDHIVGVEAIQANGLELVVGENIDGEYALTSQADFRLIVAMRNALPGLLARLAAAEAFKGQVVKVLNKRRDSAHADFLAYLDDGGDPDEPIPGAEAGEEINKIARDLGLTLGETVKGGQQNA